MKWGGVDESYFEVALDNGELYMVRFWGMGSSVCILGGQYSIFSHKHLLYELKLAEDRPKSIF